MNKIVYCALIGAITAQHPGTPCFNYIGSKNQTMKGWDALAMDSGPVGQGNLALIEHKDILFADDPGNHTFEKAQICYAKEYEQLKHQNDKPNKFLSKKLRVWQDLEMNLIKHRNLYSKHVVDFNRVQARVYEPIKQSIHAQRKLQWEHLEHLQYVHQLYLVEEHMHEHSEEILNEQKYFMSTVEQQRKLSHQIKLLAQTKVGTKQKVIHQAIVKYDKFYSKHCKSSKLNAHEYMNCEQHKIEMYEVFAKQAHDPMLTEAVNVMKEQQKSMYEFVDRFAHDKKVLGMNKIEIAKLQMSIKNQLMKVHIEYQEDVAEIAKEKKLQDELLLAKGRVEAQALLIKDTVEQIEEKENYLNHYLDKKDKNHAEEAGSEINLVQKNSSSEETFASWGTVALLSSVAVGAGFYMVNRQTFSQEKDIEESLI